MGWIDKYQDGGIIEDDRGQWAHPGKITKINSNDITMKGVDYPVLGVSNTGDKKLMQPGEDYQFEGESVTEYPIAEDKYDRWLDRMMPQNKSFVGKPKIHLAKNGAWLDKYNK